MKLYITTILFAIASFTGSSFAQLRSNNTISSTLAGQSAFLDASANGFTTTTNIGKGLAFPRTDLTTFTFATPTTGALNFPTAYDGMIVYNSATGNTVSGIATAVTPGYYYFSNPTGGNGNGFATTSGKWMPLSAGSTTVNVGTTETITNTIIDGKQIYAIKSSFTTAGTSTAVTLAAPAGMTSLVKITIYQAGTGTVYDNSVYSYTLGTGAAITGSPNMSSVYPAGTYNYVMEYMK